jgi:chromosomal replication initiator protein
MDTRGLWQAVLGELELTLSGAAFKTWFRNTAIISQQDGHVVVAVPNVITKDWLERKFNGDINRILERIHPGVESVEYRVTSDGKGATQSTAARDQLLAPAAPPSPAQAAVAPIISSSRPSMGANHTSKLNPKYTLDSFVVGPSNELAYAASQAVATYPGEKYNPFFMYGGVGLGKTHLMQAIGNEILRRDAGKRIRYVTSEEFTNEFTSTIRDKKTKNFADLYRNLDVLIVDDIQFLGNKERTQEEFFHTFNTLHQANKQVILSSDKPPKAIPNLEDRLRSRFEMGMVADIQRPDLETRAAIIQSKAESRHVELSVEVVEYLARHYQHNIRELEGALTSILGQCEIKGTEPSLVFVKALIGDAAPASRKRLPSPKVIIEKTALHFDLQPADIIGSRRDKDIVVPRQVAMYLMRTELNLSFPKIAQQVGGRDHTTAMHSIKKIEKLIEIDSDLRSDINQVKERITM